MFMERRHREGHCIMGVGCVVGEIGTEVFHSAILSEISHQNAPFHSICHPLKTSLLPLMLRLPLSVSLQSDIEQR